MKFRKSTRSIANWNDQRFAVMDLNSVVMKLKAQVGHDTFPPRITVEVTAADHLGDPLSLLLPSGLRGAVLSSIGWLKPVRALDGDAAVEEIVANDGVEFVSDVDAALQEFVEAMRARDSQSLVIVNFGKVKGNSVKGAQGDFWKLEMLDNEESPADVWTWLNDGGHDELTGLSPSDKPYRLDDS